MIQITKVLIMRDVIILVNINNLKTKHLFVYLFVMTYIKIFEDINHKL